MSEPTPQAMKIARRKILDFEALNGLQLGNESWRIISEMVAEIENIYHVKYAHEGGKPQIMTTEILKRWIKAMDVPIMNDIFQTDAPNIFYATFAMLLEPEHKQQLSALGLDVIYPNSPLRNRYMLKWNTPPDDES